MLVHLTEADAGRPTEVYPGDTVELRLPESPATGYQWRWRFPEALRLITDEYVQDNRGDDHGAPGNAGYRRLAFDVTARGDHEFRAELAKPWESAAREALTFVVSAR